MQKPSIVVQGLPPDSTREGIRKRLEKILDRTDHTHDFEVAYPISSNYCQGLGQVTPETFVAVIVFRDNKSGTAAADFLCQAKLRHTQVSRLQPQVFRELTATVRTDVLELFPRSTDLNRILARVQGRTCVGLKHQEDGTILLTGSFFQIATAQELFDVKIKERTSPLKQKKQKKSVGDEENLHSMKNSHLSENGNGFNASSVADTRASAVNRIPTTLENDPKEAEKPRHLKQVQPRIEQGLNAGANQATEVDMQNDDPASMQNQTHEDEAGDVGIYFADPEPKRSTQQQSKQPKESSKSALASLRDEDKVPDESESSDIERRSQLEEQVEASLPEQKRGRANKQNEERQADTTRASKEEEQEHEQQAEYRPRGAYSSKFSADDTQIGRAARSSSSFSSLPPWGSGESPTSTVGQTKSHGSGGRHNYDKQTMNSFGVPGHPYGFSLDQKTLSDANVYKSLVGDQIVLIYKSNIVEVRVDAVVNASNTYLFNRTGVSRAIVVAAGAVVDQECGIAIQQRPYLEETEVVCTSGGSLCKHIFHAIGPADSYSRFSSNDATKRSLQTTFKNCLQMAEKFQVTSIAIPAIGSGTSKFPESFVANALHAAVVDFCYETQSNGSLKAIHLVDIDAKQTRETNDCFKQSDHLKKFTGLKASRAGDPDAGQANTSSSVERSVPLVRGDGAAAAGHMTSSDKFSNGARAKTKSSTKEEKDDCAICMDSLEKKKTKSLKCGHAFCVECIDQALKFKKVCPICGTICGKLTGNQPKDGKMTHRVNKYSSLAGYERYGTIVIDYSFRSGIQGEEHPNPGKRYDGTTRTAYLPDNKEGNEVLELLKKAFAARLTFTIGQSVTSGRTDQVTWNDIHHKTSMYTSSYGYPDSTYLQRVKEELAAKGIK